MGQVQRDEAVIGKRLKERGLTRGAAWVALVSIGVVGIVAGATWWWWESFIARDTVTNVLRNMGFLAAGVVTWVFALWRGAIAKQHEETAKEQAVIAEEQAATARLEHLHGRFSNAQALFAQGGVENSHGRIWSLHALRYLVRDAPEEFAAEIVEILTTFMVQADVGQEGRDLKEFVVAVESARFVCDLVDEKELFDAESRRRLRMDLAGAVERLETRLNSAGIAPPWHKLMFAAGLHKEE